MQRGEMWWASLPEPGGSEPGYRRPVLIVQSDDFNRSRISTVVVAVITGNVALALAPGNVLLKARRAGLTKDSVVNVSQLITIDRGVLTEKIKVLDTHTMASIDEGLRLVLSI